MRSQTYKNIKYITLEDKKYIGTKVFTIDKSILPDCAWNSPTVTVTKYSTSKEFGYQYYIQDDKKLYNQVAKQFCGKPDRIGEFFATTIEKEFRKCAFGSLLLMLCLIDEDVNGKYGNLRENKPDRFHILTDALTAFPERKAWVVQNCQSIWMKEFKETTGQDVTKLGLDYFNAAINAGHTKMFIIDDQKKIHPNHLPPVLVNQNINFKLKIVQAQDTEYYRQKFKQKTGKIETIPPGPVAKVFNFLEPNWNNKKAKWFFCKPIRA